MGQRHFTCFMFSKDHSDCWLEMVCKVKRTNSKARQEATAGVQARDAGGLDQGQGSSSGIRKKGEIQE